MTENIRVLIAQNLGIGEEEVTEAARLREDLGMDEIASVELGMALEQLLDREVSEEDMAELDTVQDVMTLIQSVR